MAAFDLNTVFKPRPWQEGPFYTDAHTIVLKWSRRGGKGRIACMRGIDTYLALAAKPRDPSLVPGFYFGVVAPTYRNAEQAWMELQAFVPPVLIQDNGIKQDEHKIWLRSYGSLRNGLIEVRSADNESGLQGWGLDYLWVTEAQDISQAAWVKVRPATRSPGRRCVTVVEGIPPLRPDHWMNALYRQGEQKRPGFFASKMTYLDRFAWEEQVALSDAERQASAEDKLAIEQDRESMSESEWQRMYMAEDIGSVDIPMDIERVMTASVDWEKQEPEDERTYVAGLDLGQKVSATVLTVWDRTSIPWKLVYYRRVPAMDWGIQRAMIVEQSTRWMVDKLFIDAQGPGQPMYDDLRYMGVPVVAVPIQGNTRENILTKLAIAIEKNKISVPREEQIVRECRAMRRERVSDLTMRWKTHDGYTNDTVFSMALGITDLPIRDGLAPARRAPDFYGWGRM